MNFRKKIKKLLILDEQCYTMLDNQRSIDP